MSYQASSAAESVVQIAAAWPFPGERVSGEE